MKVGTRRVSSRASQASVRSGIDLDAALPVNPDLRVVTLANGFTCWIRRHARPPGAASLALYIGSGSLDEEEDERGIAHFLEHMAFRGSANYPPGAVQALFASMGTRLGTHHNAATSLDRTSFNVFLPEADEEALGRMMLCLADFAHRLSLLPVEIEREKRVILEEIRAFPPSDARLREGVLTALFPGSRLADRLPLGREETVRALTAERLRAYLLRWHRPDNSALLVVGDVDPDSIEGLLRRHFEGWPEAPEKPPGADLGVRPLGATRAVVIREPEVTEAEVRATAVLPPQQLWKVRDFRARLVGRLALWVGNRQLANLVRLGEAPFRDAQISLTPLLRAGTLARASALGPAGKAEEMLAFLLTELKRVGSHVPPAAELARGCAALRTAARQAHVADGNLGCDSLLAELEEAMGEGRPPLGKAQVVELVEALLPGIEGEEVRDAMGAYLLAPPKLLVAILPGKQVVGPEPCERLLEVLSEVEARPVAPLPSRRSPRSLMPRKPPPGRLTTVEEDTEWGVLSATLENGVRAHVREMDYRKDRVFVTVTLAGGRLRETAAKAGATTAAALAFSHPATARLSSVAIHDLLAGRTAVLTPHVDEDALTLSLASDRASLETGLQLVHLLLTQPRVEAVALARWRERIREGAEAQRRSLEVRLAERSLQLLTGGDPRFAPLTAEVVEAITLDDTQRWLEDVICPAPLEAALVGDLPRERLLEAARRYLGSLSPRSLCERDLAPLRRLTVTPGPLESILTVDTASSAAAVLVGWRVGPWQATRERHLLQMAEQVLLQRVQRELREERGLSYSPEVSFTPSKAYPEASLFSASSYAAPERARETAAIIRNVVEGLAAEGPSDGELDTVRKQLTDLARRLQRDPKYWSRSLADLDYHGGSLEDVGSLAKAFAACASDDVHEALGRSVTEERRITVVCLPAHRP